MFFYTFLPKLLNMSLTASVVIVFVFLLRLLLKRAPKVISYALWSMVLFRLLCPISIESAFSLFGLLDTPVITSGTMTSSIEYIPADIAHTEYPSVVLPVPGIGEAISDTLPQGEEQLAADPLEAPMAIATYVWMAGILAMGIYAAVSYVRLRRKLVTASPLRDNIYLADEIISPFVLGLFCPKIYLPSSIREEEQTYIILHEQHHIRRLDHIAKALAFVALCIHWFNPLVWVSFILAGKDMEMSCDEAVVKKMGDGILADYTASLLSLATGKHIIAGVPLAFGEGDTKGRIRNLAKWKKPAFWVVLVAVIVCIVLAVCLLTNPQTQTFPFELGNIQISWAKTLDCRPNEPTSFDLNDAELDELKFRLADLKIGKRDNDLGGFTPFYSISIQANGYYFSVQGFDTDGKNIALYYQGEYYRINDSEFSTYLRNICAGETRTTSASDNEISTTETIPAVQEWFNYHKSDEMKWDGRQEINLDAFPGVTFCWTPEKVEAIVGDEITPLYTGMPIWSVFFTDLTGDGLPELCSTLSIGSGIVDDRIIIYDYANDASYSLEDRMEYDYSISVQNGQLIVTKQAFSTDNNGEVVERGYLAYVNDTIQIVPLEATSAELIPGTTYVSYQCIYMNPLSSYAAMGGDSGCIYRVGEDNFETVTRSTSVQNLIEVPRWKWQELPYTDEEWAALYIPGTSAMENIHELYDEILYQPLTDMLFLLQVDSDLWLVELKNNAQMGTYLWSIYSLIPENAMGRAQWEYEPLLSSHIPVLRFEFDMLYTEITAFCVESQLVDFDSRDKTSGANLTFDTGDSLYWSPMDKDGNIVSNAHILFIVHNGDKMICAGTIYIESSGELKDGQTVYSASLVGTGLHLSQNTEWEGGIISLINGTSDASDDT